MRGNLKDSLLAVQNDDDDEEEDIFTGTNCENGKCPM